MLTVQRAPVAPRVASPTTGESVRLDHVIEELRDQHATGAVMIAGERGSGKTTALAHLAAVLDGDACVTFLDEPVLLDALAAAAERFVVFTAHKEVAIDGWALSLLPWSRDELIEYLLAVHPGACASVMQRLGDYWSRMPGSPRVWRMALDALATDPHLPTIEAALQQGLETALPTANLIDTARQYALARLLELTGAAGAVHRRLARTCPRDVLALLECGILQLQLGTEQIVRLLKSWRLPSELEYRWPDELVEAVAQRLVPEGPLTARLVRVMRRGTKEQQPMAASVLVRVIPGWRPDANGKVKGLEGAYLQEIAWNGVDLTGACLDAADFSGADLTDAVLAGATMTGAVFRDATLRGAVLNRAKVDGADFSGADLTAAAVQDARFLKSRFVDAKLSLSRVEKSLFQSADLTRARFDGASLSQSTFEDAILDETDFTNADLSRAGLDRADLRTAILDGATLTGASLNGANLEDVDWPDARLAGAELRHAQMTGSRLRGGNLRQAFLFGAELGEIDWEDADLRGADLRQASFHMGSSRSGLLITPIASEGTRTGFYTDDSEEQHFKSPEEIRKASLRRTDLRGAQIDGVDFYLVDLRGAVFDPIQEQHFRRCRAILDDE